MVSEGVGANTQHSHAHHTVMMAWFWLFTPLGGIATCSFLLCRPPLGDIHVCMSHPFRVACCFGHHAARDCVRSTRFETRRIL